MSYLFQKNEENKSIIASGTIEPNMSKTIERIASKQKEITRNHTVFNPHLKSYLKNLPISSLTTPFGKNNANEISILKMYKLEDTNYTTMENMLLLVTTIGLKELMIGSAWLVKELLRKLTNRALPLVWGHGDCYCWIS